MEQNQTEKLQKYLSKLIVISGNKDFKNYITAFNDYYEEYKVEQMLKNEPVLNKYEKLISDLMIAEREGVVNGNSK